MTATAAGARASRARHFSSSPGARVLVYQRKSAALRARRTLRRCSAGAAYAQRASVARMRLKAPGFTRCDSVRDAARCAARGVHKLTRRCRQRRERLSATYVRCTAMCVHQQQEQLVLLQRPLMAQYAAWLSAGHATSWRRVRGISRRAQACAVTPANPQRTPPAAADSTRTQQPPGMTTCLARWSIPPCAHTARRLPRKESPRTATSCAPRDRACGSS